MTDPRQPLIPLHDHTGPQKGGKLRAWKALVGLGPVPDGTLHDPFFRSGGNDGGPPLGAGAVVLRFNAPWGSINANHGIFGEADAYIALESSVGPGDPGDTASIDIHAYTDAGDIDTRIRFDSGLVRVESTLGMVVPKLAADPSGPESEEGQVYFNTSSKKFRGYDGTSWADLN